jgi:hypothetical protein
MKLLGHFPGLFGHFFFKYNGYNRLLHHEAQRTKSNLFRRLLTTMRRCSVRVHITLQQFPNILWEIFNLPMTQMYIY